MKDLEGHTAYPGAAGPHSTFPSSRVGAGSGFGGASGFDPGGMTTDSDIGGIVVDSSEVVGMVSPIGLSAEPPTSPAPLFGRVRLTQQAHHLPLEFGGVGAEYFRIWIVNLLLTLATLGLYYPWAKVRKLRWFYGHTRLAGHAFDFHGEPRKMLRGTLLVGGLALLYGVAGKLSPLSGFVAALVVASLWPLLLRSALQFRTANTSWCGLRFGFSGSALEAYQAVAAPLLLFLLPAALAAFYTLDIDVAPATLQAADVTIFIGAALLLLGLPYFNWRLKRYQHSHYRLGQLRTEWKGGVRAVYGVWLRTLCVMLAPAALIGLAIAGLSMTSRVGWLGLLLQPVALLILLGVYVVGPAYFAVRMQNLAWTKTGNRYMRLRSRLALGPYLKLQLLNWLLVLVTLGLYWPWAVVNTRRMRLAAITVVSRVEPEELVMAAARLKRGDAAGDAGDELLGFDLGW